LRSLTAQFRKELGTICDQCQETSASRTRGLLSISRGLLTETDGISREFRGALSKALAEFGLVCFSAK
jgi:hypothetical protein